MAHLFSYTHARDATADRVQKAPRGEAGAGGEAGPLTTKKVHIGTLPVRSRISSLDIPYGFPYALSMPSKPGHITLNFHPRLLERMKDYARKNGLKMNAMLKEAFELLEDHPELVVRKGPFDY